MSRTLKSQPSVVVEPIPPVGIGSLVCYYAEGWRYGHLESVKGTTARVRPIGSKYGSSPPRLVTVQLDNIKEEITKQSV